ncbi:MAG: HNH endonuclease [Acidobacteria bacterium]|nr:HNH endonuclease [Acidobacteriota bacterium]
MSEISNDLDQKIRNQAQNRCGYCLVPQKLVSYKLEIEHFHPKAKGGTDDESNLWLACRQCNLNKGVKTEGFDVLTSNDVRIFNPRNQIWTEHFAFTEDGTEIIGKTPCGRATVSALQLKGELPGTARAFRKLTGIYPPGL